MSNKEIYKKTLTFSVRRLLFDIITFVVFFGIIFLGFFIGDKAANAGIVGLVTGVIIAFIVLWLLSRFIAYTFSAGQICMMTAAITEGSLPDDVYAEGKRRVKERFGTVAIYFAATNTIRGIFRQIGRGISSLGRAVGGDAGDAAGSAISIAIDTLVRYLSDCCLGWVFFRKDVNAGKATLEGSVLFFKHGKTFGKNMGRIFGMGLASLLLIGGAFSGVFYLIFSNFKDELALLANDISANASADASTFVKLLENPTTLLIVVSVIAGVILWSILHGAFIRPFILAGVLKNYLVSGMEDIPTEASYMEVAEKSPKFAKLMKETTY